MVRKRHNQYTWPTKFLSVLLAVFVLNLCVTIPSIKTGSCFPSSIKQFAGNKKNTQFLIQAFVEFLTGDNVEISPNSSMNLLEELNEVKEDWCHQSFEYKIFLNFYTDKEHPPHFLSLFILLEDSRFSPPPELLA